MRKLPFDNGSNPMVAADKFIVRENLNKAYVEQISTFVRNNSIPQVTSDNAERKSGVPGSAAPVKGGVVSSQQEGMKTLLYFD